MIAAAGTLGQSRPLLPCYSGAPVRRGSRHGGRRLTEAARLVPRARDVRGLAEGRGVAGHRGRRGTAGRAVCTVLPRPVPPLRSFWRAAPGGRRPSCRTSPTPAPGGPCGREILVAPRERPPFPWRSSLPHQAGLRRERRAPCRPVRVGCTARARGGLAPGGAAGMSSAALASRSRTTRMPRAPVGGGSAAVLRPLPNLPAQQRPAQAVSMVVMPDEVCDSKVEAIQRGHV